MDVFLGRFSGGQVSAKRHDKGMRKLHVIRPSKAMCLEQLWYCLKKSKGAAGQAHPIGVLTQLQNAGADRKLRPNVLPPLWRAKTGCSSCYTKLLRTHIPPSSPP